MGGILKKSYPFFIAFGLFLFIGGLMLFQIEKGDIVLLLNARHTAGADVFFKYYTWVGDGLCYVLVSGLLYFYKRMYAILSFVSFALVGIMVQILKNFVFANYPRPRGFFENPEQYHWVEGVRIHLSHSFPSGHTATAFSMFCLLAIFFHPRWGLLFLVMALLAATSRVYLFQHFFVDVYFGAILGTVMTLGVYYYAQRRWEQHF